MLTQLYKLNKNGVEQFQSNEFTIEDAWEAEGDQRLKPVERSILHVLIDYHFKNNGKVYPSLATLGEEAGCTKPTLRKALKRLRELGFVKWLERGDMTQKFTHQYFLNIPKRGSKEILPVKKGKGVVKKFTLIKPSILNTNKPLYLKEPKGLIGFINTLKENPKIGKLKGRRIDVKQSELFSKPKKPKSKKDMTKDELYQGAKDGKVDLNYGEFKTVYNVVHRQVFGIAAGGKMTYELIGDFIHSLGDFDLDKPRFWQVLPEVFRQYKENNGVKYVSLWMLMNQKEAKEYVANTLEEVASGLKDGSYDKAMAKPYEGDDGNELSGEYF